MENVPYNYFSTLRRLSILNLKGPKWRLSAKVRLASSAFLPPNNRLSTLRPGPPPSSSVSPAQISFTVLLDWAHHTGHGQPRKKLQWMPHLVCPTPAVLYGRWGGRCPRVGLWWDLPIGTATCTSKWGCAQEPLWVSSTWSGPSPCCVLVSLSGACDPLWFRILLLCAILASPGW